MNISSFSELLGAAQAQLTQQQLLLVFAKAELPEDSTDAQRARFKAGEGGTLTPVACVDKNASDLLSFDALCSEAAEFIPDWDILFAGVLEAGSGQKLKAEDIDKKIKEVVEWIKIGKIDNLATFDRIGDAVNLR